MKYVKELGKKLFAKSYLKKNSFYSFFKKKNFLNDFNRSDGGGQQRVVEETNKVSTLLGCV